MTKSKRIPGLTSLPGRRPLRIFTWHIHGHYLYYLSHVPHQFYVPYRPDGAAGYSSRTASFPWGDNVIRVPAEEAPALKLDCILFQQEQNYLLDQYEMLSEEQRWLPRIYLEHEPPRWRAPRTRGTSWTIPTCCWFTSPTSTG